LPEDFFESANVKYVLDLEAVFRLFDSGKTGLIDYSEFLLFVAKHTPGTEEEKMRFAFYNAEPRGELAMRVEVLSEVCKHADKEQELTAKFALAAIRNSLEIEETATISKTQFTKYICSKSEVLEALCSSLNSCSGMAGRVEDFRKWCPNFDRQTLVEKVLPAAIRLTDQKLHKLQKTKDAQSSILEENFQDRGKFSSFGGRRRSLGMMCEGSAAVLDPLKITLGEFKGLIFDSVVDAKVERDIKLVKDKSSYDFEMHKLVCRLFAAYHGPYHEYEKKKLGKLQGGGPVIEETADLPQMLMELSAELNGTDDELAEIFFELLSLKFNNNVTVGDLSQAIDVTQQRFKKNHKNFESLMVQLGGVEQSGPNSKTQSGPNSGTQSGQMSNSSQRKSVSTPVSLSPVTGNSSRRKSVSTPVSLVFQGGPKPAGKRRVSLGEETKEKDAHPGGQEQEGTKAGAAKKKKSVRRCESVGDPPVSTLTSVKRKSRRASTGKTVSMDVAPAQSAGSNKGGKNGTGLVGGNGGKPVTRARQRWGTLMEETVKIQMAAGGTVGGAVGSPVNAVKNRSQILEARKITIRSLVLKSVSLSKQEKEDAKNAMKARSTKNCYAGQKTSLQAFKNNLESSDGVHRDTIPLGQFQMFVSDRPFLAEYFGHVFGVSFVHNAIQNFDDEDSDSPGSGNGAEGVAIESSSSPALQVGTGEVPP
jgi:hypothetical protein